MQRDLAFGFSLEAALNFVIGILEIVRLIPATILSGCLTGPSLFLKQAELRGFVETAGKTRLAFHVLQLDCGLERHLILVGALMSMVIDPVCLAFCPFLRQFSSAHAPQPQPTTLRKWG